MPNYLADCTRDIEPRLSLRRAAEAVDRRGSLNVGILRDRLAASLLKTSLRFTRLYNRGLANALQPVVRHLRFQFGNLPFGLDGFRILHLSDFHIDGLDGISEILTDKLLRLRVDLCVMTGDYRFEVYGSCAAIYPRMRRIVGAIQATHGVVGILGNHDCADIAVEFERLGVRMLVNEAVQVGSRGDGLWVIGIDHPHRPGRAELHTALEGVPCTEFKLLLAHTPETFEEAAELGIDLYLTGHTHAGQIRLPVVGPIITHAKSPRRFAQGHWRHQSMQGFTTAGVGCSLLPIRFGCPPEIAVIELSRP